MFARKGVWSTLVACAMVGAAHASEWVPITAASDKNIEFFVDVSSIKSAGDITRAWTKLVFAEHTQRGTGNDSKKWTAYSMARYAYRCGEGDQEAEAMYAIFEDGTYSEAPPETVAMMTWQPVPPDTVGDALMKFVCSWKPPPQASSPPSNSGDAPPPDAAALPIKTIRMPDCGEDYYPVQALRLNQHGTVVVRVCVGVDNKVDRPVEVLRTSGFPLLDEAAVKCLGAGSYKAGIVDDHPAASCKEFNVTFAPLPMR